MTLYIAFAVPKGRTAPATGTGTNNANAFPFIAYTIDSDGAFEHVSNRATWSSSDDSIAQPLAGGVSAVGSKQYRANSPGTAEAIARFEGLEARAPLMVVPAAVLTRTPRIDLTWAGLSSPITVGSVSRATAFMRPSNENVSGAASWTSSDPSVATVEGGLIRAISRGTTIITANVDGQVDWFWLSVVPPS